MLIKLRFIGLLLILLLNTSAFGQKPLQELQQELTDWTNIVNNNEWWIFPTEYGAVTIIPRRKGIEAYITDLKMNGASLSKYDILEKIDQLRRFSNNQKQQIQNNFIPQLKEQIKHHPDNPNNPLNPFDPNIDPHNPIVYTPEPIEYNNELDLPELGVQCPKSNPGNKLKNKFDNNNNTYVLCNYFNDGVLQYQMPYVNGKKEGIYLLFKGKHFNTRVPHPLADLKPYKNGKRHGVGEVWLIDKNSGQHWQLYKTDYTNGQKHGEQIKYYQNGTLNTVSMFNYGKTTTYCHYRKDGSLVSCKQY